MIKVELTFSDAKEAARLFNTMAVLDQNLKAAAADAPVAGPTPAAEKNVDAEDAKEESKPAKRTRAPKAPEAAAPSAPPAATAAAVEETISRDEALAYLRAIAEAKKISGPDLITFLKKTFGVPKFSDIPTKRYVELKNLASEAAGTEADPMA